MEIAPFIFSGVPDIIYGPGKIKELPEQIKKYGRRILLVTGDSSLARSGRMQMLIDHLTGSGIGYRHITIKNEPSPEIVDAAVSRFRSDGIAAVVAVGGGSVVDCGKAISAMIPVDGSVMDYLEGAGMGKAHDGRKLPFIAVPTTAGTGSEATKNAVLSRIGPLGFKKSLRHEKFVPDTAIIDPELALGTPGHITAAAGMDAFTQLLGSYVSKAASPFTDALALKGLEIVRDSLVPLCNSEPDNISLRGSMALAALFSGLALANAGLGIIHGLASPIGGYFDIPHGVICGSLAGEAIRMNISILLETGGNVALDKYARAGSLLTGADVKDIRGCCMKLIETVYGWIDELNIPRLGAYGVKEMDVEKIIDGAGYKNNPVPLTREQIRSIVINRL